jgi:riboflavin biosynthesis pyrimidine reductase
MTFAAFEEDKAREADSAAVLPLTTIDETPIALGRGGIGNNWTRKYYDGDFALVAPPVDRPAVTLVFVESRDGNTGANNPEELGGGPTDKHLIYEGLSRVAADAVLAGAGSARGRQSFFSVWRQELIALRHALGLPRHPTQIVVSNSGLLDVGRTLLFNVPQVNVIVIAGASCVAACGEEFAQRPCITVMPFAGDWIDALIRLKRDHGIRRISAIGGRRTATGLVDAGAVQDLCLTKTRIVAGEANTPWYAGDRRPRCELIARKHQSQPPFPIVFEHLALV